MPDRTTFDQAFSSLENKFRQNPKKCRLIVVFGKSDIQQNLLRPSLRVIDIADIEPGLFLLAEIAVIPNSLP